MAIRNFTNKELAECAEREVTQRKRVYTRQVESGHMSINFAERQIKMMEEIAAIIRGAADRDAQKEDLFGGGRS